MIKIFLAYLIILQLVIEINSQNTFINPLKRGTHTATLVNRKLYILGGYSLSGTEDEVTGQQFFYAEFSEPFSITGIRWVDLTSINLIPPHRRAAAVRGGENDDKIILYGGDQITRELAMVYSFDTENLSWSIPKLTGSYHPLNKSSLVPIIANRKMYLFGGYLYSKFIPNNYMDDMTIFDTLSNSSTLGSYSDTNKPTPRGYYGAVLLSNQKILYFGGTNNAIIGKSFPLDVVYLYDTIKDEWGKQPTNGDIPSNRDAFSAVLDPTNERVIVYGGSGFSENRFFGTDVLYVLNVNNWTWSVPKVSGTFPAVAPYSHRAVLIDNYMVVTFGNSENQTLRSEIQDISLLDISRTEEYVWTNIFIPRPSKTTTTFPSTLSPTSSSKRLTECNIILFSWMILCLMVSFI